MRVWLYCFIVYIKILSYSRQSLLTKQQIRLEVTIISQQVYICTHHPTPESDHWQDMKVAQHLNTQVFLAVGADHRYTN